MAFTDVQKNLFLTHLANCGIVASACRAADTDYRTVYQLRKTDDDFRAAWEDALELATDNLEQEARRRALDGVNEPVVYQGQLTPVWERDATGQLVMETYDTGQLDKEKAPIFEQRPKQLVVAGVPQFLTVKKHSDPLLMFLLKGNRNKFKDSSKIELTGKDGGPVAVNDTVKAARLASLLALASARQKGESFDDLA